MLQLRTLAPFGAVTAFALMLGLAGCASSPTASPESTARTFLEAMKANSLSAALAVVDPTSSPLSVGVGETAFALPDSEQAAGAATGVTGYEIINQVMSEHEIATITAEVTGGTVTQFTFSIGKGGPTGEDWLIRTLEPGFSTVKFGRDVVADHWTVALAGGTLVPGGTESLVMLPGTALDGATATDRDGYFEPVTLEVRDRELEGTTFVATGKGVAAATSFYEKLAKEAIDATVAGALAQSTRVRVISEPSVSHWRFEPQSSSARIEGEVSTERGHYEVCLNVSVNPNVRFGPTKPTLVSYRFIDMTASPFEEEGPTSTSGLSFVPYLELKTLTGIPFFVNENWNDGRPLSDCGL